MSSEDEVVAETMEDSLAVEEPTTTTDTTTSSSSSNNNGGGGRGGRGNEADGGEEEAISTSERGRREEAMQEDFVFNQTSEKENSFYNALFSGFQSLKEARDTKKTPLFDTNHHSTLETPDKSTLSSLSSGDGSHAALPSRKTVPMHVSVNFIDPTTKPTMTPPKVENLLSKSRLNPPGDDSDSSSKGVGNVFEKLHYIFQRDYGSTLRSVQYKNMRSGGSDVISSIPVDMILTRTGNASGTGEAANVAWGGMAGSAAVPSTDPAEWHNSPFCHVYIAACESMEHYRTKVRPSLQAFVSQLEASTGPPTSSGGKSVSSSVLGSPAGTSAPPASNSVPYLVVFVPAGGGGGKRGSPKNNGTNSDDMSVSSGPVRRALASQFAKARHRIANYQQESNQMDNNSVHSKDSLGSGDGNEGPDDDPESASLSLQMLTTNEKLLYKKLVQDFSSGKVCVLSRTSLDTMDESQAVDSTAMAVRTQEWNSFNRMLGSVIVNGFKDRCRKYNDELRRLDAQRAIAAQAAKSPGKTPPQKSGSGGFFGVGSSSKTDPSPPAAFNLGYFFLVKESLAFTYEQMQLPAEALLQYDEFRAFLPDLNDKEHKNALKLRQKSKALNDDAGPPLAVLADAADFVGFRKRLRAEFDLTPILEIVRRYLFAREIRLLFKMEQPVEVITRCEAFCKHMYFVMMRGIAELSEEERKQRQTEAAKWVIQFAWDVKSTCENYLLPDGTHGPPSRLESFDTMSVDTPGSDLSESANSSQSDQNIASRLGELLEMARLLFKELGDTELPGGNPLRKYEKTLPADMFHAWEPWNAPEVSPDDIPAVPKFGREAKTIDRQFLLEEAFSSPEYYENVYLDIAGAIVNLSRYGHRRRLAFRLQSELAEHLIRTGNLKAAAAVLKSIVKVYRWDQWDRCHFWRLFRLSYCQRTTAAPTDYLKTLATCFSPRTTTVAPKKALEALLDDLEVVMGYPTIGESKYGTIAFLETSIDVLESPPVLSTLGSGVDRKQVLKRFCSVGETIAVTITITSHLPREIELQSLKLFIVDFASFSTIIENRESVEEDDAAKTLGTKKGVKLSPGKNAFTFDWAPSAAGQFILSTLEVVWKQGFFYYDSMELPAPLLEVDVLPSEPTQSLSLDPVYLVPGHDQEVRITFDAGSDLVVAGKVQLLCSDGITLIGPGEDPAAGQWKKEYEIELGQCKPGEKTVLTAHVRCALIDTFSHDSISQMPSFDTAHGLKVKAFTKYLHAGAEGSDHSETQKMKTVLEALAPILEKTALSVESVEPLWLIPGERVMISVNLMSNTPDHFSVVDWSLLVPPPLKLADGVDLNEDLLQCAVSDGDQLSFSFECNVGLKTELSEIDEAVLRVKLCDDNKKLFSLDLPLDLDAFYLHLLDSNLPKVTSEAKASLKLEGNEGPMGEPTKLTFTVETEAEGEIVYSIDSAGTHWLLSGKVNGSMQRSGFMSLGFMASCEVVGIPTVPGVLTSFPKIKIGTVSMNGGYTPLKMKVSAPDSFRSISQTSAVGVAFPTNKIAI